MKIDFQAQLKRIEKAITLISSGSVTPMGAGRWHVKSDTQAMGYRVTLADSCHCFDFTETLKRESPCKHLWAAIGGAAAMLISDIEQAANIAELEATGKTHADDMLQLPETFVKVARAFYRRRHCELSGCGSDHSNNTPSAPSTTSPAHRTSSREDEAKATLVKTQPRSLGSINGIEI